MPFSRYFSRDLLKQPREFTDDAEMQAEALDGAGALFQTAAVA